MAITKKQKKDNKTKLALTVICIMFLSSMYIGNLLKANGWKNLEQISYTGSDKKEWFRNDDGSFKTAEESLGALNNFYKVAPSLPPQTISTPAPTISYTPILIEDYPILKYVSDVSFTNYSDVYDIVQQEAYANNILLLDATTLIDTESSFRNAKNKNKNSTDFGPAQLNNKGEPLEYFLGKGMVLADGRKEIVSKENYKTDVRLNIAIGLLRFKDYLSRVNGDPFAAYAIYNIGPGAEKYVKGKRGPVEVITAVRNAGQRWSQEGANNIKNNFWVKYEKWRKKLS